jgi:hypothetical protein
MEGITMKIKKGVIVDKPFLILEGWHFCLNQGDYEIWVNFETKEDLYYAHKTGLIIGIYSQKKLI